MWYKDPQHQCPKASKAALLAGATVARVSGGSGICHCAVLDGSPISVSSLISLAPDDELVVLV
jgi:hypothetical protein